LSGIDETPAGWLRRGLPQRFFCVSTELGRTLGGTDLDGDKPGGGFFGCFGFFASRLLRN